MSILVGLLVVAALLGVNFYSRSVVHALHGLSGTLAEPSQVSANDFEKLRARVKHMEKEYSAELDDMLQNALDARKERERVEETLRSALRRIAKGDDGESAIVAEAAAHGVEMDDGSEPNELLTLHQGGEFSREDGKQRAKMAKWA